MRGSPGCGLIGVATSTRIGPKRVVARADAGAEAQIVEARPGRGRDVAAVEEGHDAEIADPDPRLDRELGEAAPPIGSSNTGSRGPSAWKP